VESAEESTPDLVSNDILSQLDEVASVNMGPREREPSETRQKEIPNDLMQRVKMERAQTQPPGGFDLEISEKAVPPASSSQRPSGTSRPPLPGDAYPGEPASSPKTSKPWKKIVIAIVVLVILATAGIGGYVMYQKGRVVSFLERELSIPSSAVYQDMRKRLPEKGCAVDVIQLGIRPASDEDLDAYRSRTGQSGATGTHMIWIKAACIGIGGVPVSMTIRAEKPDALPAPYRGKHMVYDPDSDRMTDYVPVAE